jgi:RNA polymerase sigma-70 factor (ECF subfamily)
MTLEEEHSLVIAAQSGSKDALGILWDEFSPKLFGYLMNTLRNRTVAEDVFQSVWLQVSTKLSSFTFRGISISSWLFTIARNECRQHWRREARAAGYVSLNDSELVADSREETDNLLLVEQLLRNLSEEDRELLRLRYIADLSVGEIARVLHINPVAARVRMSRALARAKMLAI